MAEQNINVAQQDTLETVASNVNTINTNAARLTAARATKIDNIGATGDTGGSSTAGTLFGKLNKIISDIASFVGNWTATRAGYIDTIKSNTDRLTSARATIIDNIGATGNTGGSATAGTVMAKLNAIITKLNSSSSGSSSAIKSIQHGHVKNGFSTGTATINAVNVNKSVLIINGYYNTYARFGSSGDEFPTYYATLTNSTTVTGYSSITNGNSNKYWYIYFTVIEFN